MERCERKTLTMGNIAVAEGAIQAGCRAYFGYPITPQNEIPEYLSRRLPEVGGIFLQAESELASINMVLGASAAGTRVMTSSSGPGISLMQEGISFLAGSQLPAVIVNVMRCGPGLGGIKPTQADYFQATRGGGHGDYRTLVLAPNNVQEMFDFTVRAFELADKYRNPVLILADAILGQMKEPATLVPEYPPLDFDKTDWILNGAHQRPARNLRSMYLEDDDQEDLNYVLQRKYERMEQDEPLAEERWTEDAGLLVVAFGTSARVARAAVTQARNEGIRAGVFRPITLYPYPRAALRALGERIKRMLVVEMNCGQMLEDVLAIVPPDVEVRFHGRPGGGVPTPDEILEKIKES